MNSSKRYTAVILLIVINGTVLSADYRSDWWEPAKAAWNAANPTNTYDFNWWTYTWPTNADHTAGSPPDAPINPHDWMDLAGMGMSMKIDLPSSNGRYNYPASTIQAWKAKGFRNGRFHLTPYDPNFQDPSDPELLNTNVLAELRDTCQRFVDEGIPVVVSMNSDSEVTDDTVTNRPATFNMIVQWWRQVAETLKDQSHLVTFENFIEYHGFGEAAEKKFAVELPNSEVRYPDYANYRGRRVDNWVRFPGMNNLMVELSRVIRETNPTRIMIYKPVGIGRGNMPTITPYRWDTEGDPQGLTNTNTPYWIQSVGGSANVKWEYVQSTRESDPVVIADLLALARRGSWGPAVDYYHGTGNPVWISLWGLQLTQTSIDSNLGGIAPPDSIFVDYINWYQDGIQTTVTNASGEQIKLPCGFQQSWWLWDYDNDTWFQTDQGANIGDPVPILNALAARTWQPFTATNEMPTATLTPGVLAQYDFFGGSLASTVTNTHAVASVVSSHPTHLNASMLATQHMLATDHLLRITDDNTMLEFTLAANPGKLMDLTSLKYTWHARISNSEDTHYSRVFSSADGFAAEITNSSSGISSIHTNPPYIQSVEVDLSGPAFQAVSSITFKVIRDFESNAGQDSASILSSKSFGDLAGYQVETGAFPDVVLSGWAYDPLAPDNDSDYVPDIDDPDDDNDQMLDVDEVLYGLDPFDPSDAYMDSDGDRIVNLYEVLGGTNPTNAQSVLQLTSAVGDALAAQFHWSTISGRTYIVEYKHEMSSAWQPLPGAEALLAVGGEASLSDTNVHASFRAFRVKVIVE